MTKSSKEEGRSRGLRRKDKMKKRSNKREQV